MMERQPEAEAPVRMRAPGQAAIPRCLHFTWRTRDVPERYRPFVRSWTRMHPGWKARIWTDADLRDFVARHDPGFLPVFDGYPDPIERVDAARYLILAHLGGVFVDLDLECFRAVDPLLAGESLVIGLEPDSHGRTLKATRRGIERILCPTFLASAPGHPFWADVRGALVAARHEPDPLDATGPFLLSRVHRAYRGPAPLRLLDPDLIYPVDRDQSWTGALFDIEAWAKVARHAYAHHHWDGTWFRAGEDARFGAPQRVTAAITEGLTKPTPTTLRFGPEGPQPDPVRHLVSCLMVTNGRAPLAEVAIRCFQAQTWPARELVIVDDSPDPALADTVRALADPRIRHIALPAEGRTLGDLRNLAVDAAQGAYICQWDDDDLYDPLRIEYQMRAMAMTQSEACFLTRWMQWMPALNAVSVSTRRVWEGSVVCRRSRFQRYPDRRRGEDTPVTGAILLGSRTVHLDLPRLYLYVGHERNTHGSAHHRHLLNTATARFTGARSWPVLRELARRLPLMEYERGLKALAERPPAPIPPPRRPLDAIAVEARQAMTEERFEDALADWEEVLRHGDDFQAAAGRGEALARLRRFEAATEQFRRLAEDHPQAPDGPAGLGRLLVAAEKFDEAREAFMEALRRDPDHAWTLVELGILALRAGREADAEDRFARARVLAPDDERAWMGLAALATRRDQWAEALQRWQDVWDRFRSPSAPQEVAGALLALGRLEDAWRFLDSVPPDAWGDDIRIFATAWLAKLAHDGRRLLETLDRERPRVLADETLRRMLIEALTLNGRAGDAAEIVAEAGIGRTPTSQMIAMHALLVAGREDLAGPHFRALARAPTLLRTSPRLLPDILARLRQESGPAGVRRALDALDGAAKATRELRLAARFEREYADSLDALTDGAALPPGKQPRRLTIPANEADIPAGWNGDPLPRAWDAVEAARQRHPVSPLDPRINLADALELADRIAAAVADGQPLSLVRLGDGEGNFLPYAPDLADRQAQDQRSIQRLWWSDRTLDRDETARIETALADAIRNADIVGIPDQYRLANSLGRAMRPGQTSRGLLAAVEQFGGTAPSPGGRPLAGPDTILTSCHVHGALAGWRLWDAILGRAGTCAVVTGRRDLAPALERRFGLRAERTYLVPAERKYVRGMPGEAAGPHYPDGLERISRELEAVRPGQVVLVAAGVLGKVYCARIKAAGGIALDVGSAADHWCGHATRTIDEAAFYRAPPGLPAAYAARPDLDRAYAALRPAAFFRDRT